MNSTQKNTSRHKFLAISQTSKVSIEPPQKKTPNIGRFGLGKKKHCYIEVGIATDRPDPQYSEILLLSFLVILLSVGFGYGCDIIFISYLTRQQLRAVKIIPSVIFISIFCKWIFSFYYRPKLGEPVGRGIGRFGRPTKTAIRSD